MNKLRQRSHISRLQAWRKPTFKIADKTLLGDIPVGEFLMMSGVAEGSEAAVEGALRDFAGSQKSTLTRLEADAAVDERELLVIATSAAGHVTVVYPFLFDGWDDASSHLSRTLSKNVLSLHIHDGDLWMHTLFVSGEDVGGFTAVPGYWGEENEEAAQSGDADLLCRHWPGSVSYTHLTLPTILRV